MATKLTATKVPNLFTGLGITKGEYKIILKKDAKLYALTTPRKIPQTLAKGQVEEGLKLMEALGVIFKVDIRTTE